MVLERVSRSRAFRFKSASQLMPLRTIKAFLEASALPKSNKRRALKKIRMNIAKSVAVGLELGDRDGLLDILQIGFDLGKRST